MGLSLLCEIRYLLWVHVLSLNLLDIKVDPCVVLGCGSGSLGGGHRAIRRLPTHGA